MSKINKNIMQKWQDLIRRSRDLDRRTEIDDILRNIDRYTRIDDLLVTMIKVNAELTRQQNLTNQILLAMAEGGVMTGKIPEVTISQTYTDILERYGMGEDYETLTDEWKSKTITGNEPLMDVEGSGVISEMVLMSTIAGGAANGVYTVIINTDGNDIYNDTYANFAVVSDYYQDISAFSDATYYVSNFSTIYYNKRIKINIVNSTATFTRIFIKRIQKVR